MNSSGNFISSSYLLLFWKNNFHRFLDVGGKKGLNDIWEHKDTNQNKVRTFFLLFFPFMCLISPHLLPSVLSPLILPRLFRPSFPDVFSLSPNPFFSV